MAIALFLASCSTKNTNPKSDVALGDTLQFPSGLKYYYIEHGNGRNIKKGAKVNAYMKLYVEDSLYWSTNESPDSVLTFIQGRASLIKGSLELFPLLKEGDEVVAIMPPSIAYGPDGRGEIPGGATLEFNPVIIKEVSKPKKILGDTLYAVIKTEGVESAIETYHNIINSDLASNYHTDLNLFRNLLEKLNNEKQFQELEQVSAYFKQLSKKERTKELFGYYKLTALEQLGKYQQAIVYLKKLLQKYPENSFLLNKLKELQRNVN